MARSLTTRTYGGTRQLSIVDDHDLAAIDALDPARWAATSVPVADLRCDPAFLEGIDSHSKGRVRVSELVAARDWAFARLADRRGLVRRSDVLSLAAIDTSHDAGKKLRQAAAHVLAQLGTPAADSVSLAQVRQFLASYATTLANGDGVVCPSQLPDPEAAAYVSDVLAVVPGADEVSGAPGVGTAELARFLAGAEEWLAWRRRGDEPAVRPWGPETDAAAALVDELDPKIEEFFLHCDLARLQGAPAEATKLADPSDPAAIERHLLASPIAAPNADGVLKLDAVSNPAYQERIDALFRTVLPRALGGEPTALTRASWRQAKAVFDGFREWSKARPPEPYEELGPERVQAMLASPVLERVRQFMAQDLAAAPEVQQVKELERLILHQRWLLELANNVVNFSAIYHPEATALVERGSLVIDGRRLDFCVEVKDRAAHKQVAADSLIFLVYASISAGQDEGRAPFEVVAPVTSGERGRLRVGKRGIFIDTDGREWDAVIVDIVENPISVREAMVAPFRRAAAFVSKKIEDLAGSKLSSAEAVTQAKLGEKVETLPDAAPAPAAAPGAPPAPAPAPTQPSAFQNVVLMGSVALAALGSAMAYIVSAVASISPLELVGGLVSVVGLIALLSGFLGWLKLRRRDMSFLLEANGWAVNAPMRVTHRAAGLFTRTPAFPRGTRRDLTEERLPDDFDETTLAAAKRRRRRRLILFLLLLALAGAVTWLAWSPDHRQRARGWVRRARSLVTGEASTAPVESR